VRTIVRLKPREAFHRVSEGLPRLHLDSADRNPHPAAGAACVTIARMPRCAEGGNELGAGAMPACGVAPSAGGSREADDVYHRVIVPNAGDTSARAEPPRPISAPLSSTPGHLRSCGDDGRGITTETRANGTPPLGGQRLEPDRADLACRILEDHCLIFRERSALLRICPCQDLRP
jgi:hypothetical protein